MPTQPIQDALKLLESHNYKNCGRGAERSGLSALGAGEFTAARAGLAADVCVVSGGGSGVNRFAAHHKGTKGTKKKTCDVLLCGLCVLCGKPETS